MKFGCEGEHSFAGHRLIFASPPSAVRPLATTGKGQSPQLHGASIRAERLNPASSIAAPSGVFAFCAGEPLPGVAAAACRHRRGPETPR
jgi:hypothetical protein